MQNPPFHGQELPYDGQGEPLDTATGLDGDWIVEGHLFLFRPPPHRPLVIMQVAPGLMCPGINVGQIAFQFGCPPDEIVSANKHYLLNVAWQEVPPTVLGAERTAQFIFTLPGKESKAIEIQMASFGGRA